jgi:hypothetical protein
MKKKKKKTGTLDVDTLKQMVRGIMSTRADEIDCNECFKQLDHFSELSLAGKSADEAMPLVKHHLETCPDCKEEFEVLLKAINAVSPKGG